MTEVSAEIRTETEVETETKTIKKRVLRRIHHHHSHTTTVADTVTVSSSGDSSDNGGGGGDGCSPNYDPCVPDVPYDLDSADIGHPVAVVGDDVYGFDRDGDGSACEWS